MMAQSRLSRKTTTTPSTHSCVGILPVLTVRNTLADRKRRTNTVSATACCTYTTRQARTSTNSGLTRSGRCSITTPVTRREASGTEILPTRTRCGVMVSTWQIPSMPSILSFSIMRTPRHGTTSLCNTICSRSTAGTRRQICSYTDVSVIVSAPRTPMQHPE